ncbi:MAG: Type 1 glutamine amidotransferase-like domain-containing protein [Candidatus Nanoarchaeia archaeon]
MGKIIAIGGGEIGRPGQSIETKAIDLEIIKLTGKKHPNLLFIPTASSDSRGYCGVVKDYFGKKLGCRVKVLSIINEELSNKEIESKILSSDIVYVGGGNTLKMMNLWRKKEVDVALRKAYAKGVVLSGVSAGAICWFKYGNSDSRKFTSDSNKLIKVKGLGFIDALHCPHFDVEKHRPKDLKRMIKKTKGVSIALENCTALEVVGDKYRIIKSKKKAKAYKTFYLFGKYKVEEIKESKEFLPLSTLLKKH